MEHGIKLTSAVTKRRVLILNLIVSVHFGCVPSMNLPRKFLRASYTICNVEGSGVLISKIPTNCEYTSLAQSSLINLLILSME